MPSNNTRILVNGQRTSLKREVVDSWNDAPWKIAIVDGKPAVYSVGTDRDNDGGNHHADAKEWNGNPDDLPEGDWVVWSKPE